MSNKLIPNHTQRRRLVNFTSSMEVVDVFAIRRQKRPGNPHYQTTFHDPNEGTFSLCFDVATKSFSVRNLVTKKVNTDPKYIRSFLTLVPAELIEWLEDAPYQHHSNFLPIGFGWDGVFSRSEKTKIWKLKNLILPDAGGSTELPEGVSEEILNVGCRTPKDILGLFHKRLEGLKQISFSNVPFTTQYVICKTRKGDIVLLDVDRQVTDNGQVNYSVSVPIDALSITRVCFGCCYSVANQSLDYLKLEVYSHEQKDYNKQAGKPD